MVIELIHFYNSVALRKAKIVCSFGLSECNIGFSCHVFSLVLLEKGGVCSL